LQDRIAEAGIETWAIVINIDEDVRVIDRRRGPHSRARELAGVVERVAQHLAEILPLHLPVVIGG
jgi:hypothetical protein